MNNLTIVAADIGSVSREHFGWYCDEHRNGTRPEALVDIVSNALNAGQPVALGFECPLFVPLAETPENLTKARIGEGARPWSAGAGCGALATGIVQVTWVMRAIRNKLTRDTQAHLCWRDFHAANNGLFIWEAFVAGNLKATNHVGDAANAVKAFRNSLPNPGNQSRIRAENEVFSIIGTAILRTGWSTDLKLLSTPCHVI